MIKLSNIFEMVKNLILDTDILCDPDDFFALLMALKSREVNLAAIITSDEHEQHRAKFVKKIVKKNTPVFSGEDIGNSKYCFHYESDEVVRTDYLDFVQEMLNTNETIHYACISPQSNLAKIIDLSGSENLDVTIMGGAINYRKKGPEHNIKMDVKSALKVFNSNIKKRYVISDTTFKPEIIGVSKNHYLYTELSKSNELLKKNCDDFFEKFYPQTIMHDPLTLSSIIMPQLVFFENKKINMLEDGVMVFDENGKDTIISCGAQYKSLMKLIEKRI